MSIISKIVERFGEEPKKSHAMRLFEHFEKMGGDYKVKIGNREQTLSYRQLVAALKVAVANSELSVREVSELKDKKGIIVLADDNRLGEKCVVLGTADFFKDMSKFEDDVNSVLIEAYNIIHKSV